MSIADRLTELQQVKIDMKTAIEGKGQDLSGVPFTEYAGKIDAISVGISSKPIPLTVTENGVYENEKGFSPVTVNIKNKIPTDTTATAGDITEGKTAYVNGEKVVGTNTDTELLTKLLTRTNAEHMFGYCTQLKTIPQIDTSRMTDMNGMFYECKLITTIPEFDTSNVVNMRYLCRGCDNLITIPELDTRKVTSMHQAFFYCISLTTIPKLDVRNVTDLAHVVNGCKSLQTCLFRNIKTALTVGSGGSYGHLLTVESLIHLIYELRDTGSLNTLTMGNVNLNKLANVYVRLVEITDEMRAKDDLIDEKLPFEVCESTDEGAIQIVEYAKLKNWNIG